MSSKDEVLPLDTFRRAGTLILSHSVHCQRHCAMDQLDINPRILTAARKGNILSCFRLKTKSLSKSKSTVNRGYFGPAG